MSTIIVSSDTSVVITSNEISNVLIGTSESSSVITSGEIGPQGLSAYLVAVEEGFVGTQQEWTESLYGNPRDLVITKGVNEIATLTVNFSNRLTELQNISGVVSVVAEPSLTIGDIAFQNKNISFSVQGGSLYSGHRVTVQVQTTTPTATVPATIYIMNI